MTVRVISTEITGLLIFTAPVLAAENEYQRDKVVGSKP